MPTKNIFTQGKKLLLFLKPLHTHIFIVMGIVGLLEVLSIVYPLFYQRIIDDLIAQKPITAFINTALWGIGFILVQEFFTYVQQRAFFSFQWKWRSLVETEGYKKLMDFSIGQHQSKHSGVKFTVFQQGVGGFANMVPQIFFTIIPSFVSIVGILVFLSFLEWRLGLGSFLLIALYGISEYLFTKQHIRPKLMHLTTIMQKRWGVLNERLREIETVKQFGKEEHELQEHKTSLKETRSYSHALWIPTFLWQRIRGSLLEMGHIGLLFAGILFIREGSFSIGYFFLFSTWSTKLFGSLRSIMRIQQEFLGNLTTCERLIDLIATPTWITESIAPQIRSSAKGDIQFSGITFRYGEKDTSLMDTLHKLDLHIPAGKTIALVGYSGSGKSTILKLLQRYFDPQEGHISIDNIPLQDLSFASLRKLIGVVPQDVRLFDGTLKDNILYGLEDPHDSTEENLQNILHISRVDSIIEKLPQGIDTHIGENGVHLSGGEKQRVGIARALIKNPAILLFDEATSSLDSKYEQEITAAMKEASQGRTTIIVAHRLSTIQHADMIVLLEEGNITGKGSHEELLRSSPVYQEFIKLQSIQ